MLDPSHSTSRENLIQLLNKSISCFQVWKQALAIYFISK